MGTWLARGAAFALFISFTASQTASADNDADAAVIAEAFALLEASTPEQLRLGIEALGLLSTPEAAEAVVVRAQRGLPRDLLAKAVSTLGEMAQPAAIPFLVDVTRHRDAAIRASALDALGAFPDETARGAALRGLDDSDLAARRSAIAALGRIGDERALPSLRKSFERGMLEAADAIGSIGGPNEVAFLIDQLGHVPLPIVLNALGEALRRDELPESLRLDVVWRLTDLATVEVRSFFQGLAPSLPGNSSDPVRRAVGDAIVRISG